MTKTQNKKEIVRRGREFIIIRRSTEKKFRLYIRFKNTWVQLVKTFASIKDAEIYAVGFENKVVSQAA